MGTIARGEQRRHGYRALIACLGTAALLGSSAPVSPQVESEPVLSAVRSLELKGDLPDATGAAITRFFAFADGTCEEDLRVEVQHLKANARYEVLIDGTPVVAIVTDASGAASVLLAAPIVPGVHATAAPLFPVNGVHSIVVRDTGRTVVLSGDFANALRRERILSDDGRLSD